MRPRVLKSAVCCFTVMYTHVGRNQSRQTTVWVLMSTKRQGESNFAAKRVHPKILRHFCIPGIERPGTVEGSCEHQRPVCMIKIMQTKSSSGRMCQTRGLRAATLPPPRAAVPSSC